MPCVALWGVLWAFWECRRVVIAVKIQKRVGGALKCDYGGLVLFVGVDQGQKKRQLQRHEYRRSCFFVCRWCLVLPGGVVALDLLPDGAADKAV